MTPEQQRIAIAEACGWKGISHEHLTGYAPWRPTPYIERVMGDLDSIPLDLLPDYLYDLNAMHEAEKTFADDDVIAEKYWLALYDATEHTRWPYDATARQRCIAFLKTLNLWKD